MKIPFKFDSLSSSSHCRPFVSISHLSFSFNNNDSSNEFFYFSKIWSFFDLSLLSFFERKILLWKTRIHDSLSSLLFTFLHSSFVFEQIVVLDLKKKKMILSEFHEELHTVLPLSFTKQHEPSFHIREKTKFHRSYNIRRTADAVQTKGISCSATPRHRHCANSIKPHPPRFAIKSE